MKGRILRHTLLITLVLLVVGVIGVAAEGEGTVEFTNLSDGDTISELTILKGTVEFREFLKYEIFLKSGDQMIWVANSHSPVVGGNLARLDPRVFNSGDYQIVVRKVYPDSQYSEVDGPAITIDNPNGPLPYYPEVEPSFLYPSDTYAVVRAKNCAGEDFFFDYQSPGYSGSAGEMTMTPKTADGICIFNDFVVLPAHYSGTAKGGAQTEGQPVEFDAEAGKTYEIVFIGGGHRITGQEVPPDAMYDDDEVTAAAPTKPDKVEQALPTTGQESTESAGVAPPAPEPAPTKVAPASKAPAAQPEAILPETGNRMEKGSIYALISILVIVFLLGGGLLAMGKRKQPL